MFSILLQTSPNAGWLLASDKIYAVMTVILLIFAGMVSLLVLNNRKVQSLERKMEELEKQASSTPISQKNSL
jgi:hypothetical protein